MDEEPVAPADDLTALGALAEPNRRALYEYVIAQQDWVGREQAADALGLRRGIAAHHLDRLADDGLLEVDFQRLTGRQGPGAGRPAKVYRRAAAEMAVSLPPRQYDLVGELLAEATDRVRLEGLAMDTAVDEAARSAGRALAARPSNPSGQAAATGARAARTEQREAVLNELEAQGFEPEVLTDGTTVLHNCPFHRLSQRHTDLICGMNLSLLDGLLEGYGDAGLSAELAPATGYCCVRFRPVPADDGATTATS
jgi:predicted ArsR family transcriptional regulator